MWRGDLARCRHTHSNIVFTHLQMDKGGPSSPTAARGMRMNHSFEAAKSQADLDLVAFASDARDLHACIGERHGADVPDMQAAVWK